MKRPTLSPTQAALIFASIGTLGTALIMLAPSHTDPKFTGESQYSQKQELTSKVCLSFTNSTACTTQRARLNPTATRNVDSFRACEDFGKKTLADQKARFATIVCESPDGKEKWVSRCTTGDRICSTVN